MRCHRTALLLIGSTLAALGIVACGSDSEPTVEPSETAPLASPSATEQPASPSPTQPPPTGTPAQIAVPGPQSHRLLLIEGESLFIQEIDGTRREIARIDPAEGVASYPAWSPDGESIAFVRRRGYSGEADADWGDDLLIVPAAGGEPRLLRQHSMKGELIVGLAWRPDSERLLLGQLQIGFNNGVPSRTESTAIVEIGASTGASSTVLDGGYDPSLSAEGTRMAYLRFEETGIATIMVANADGSDAIVLAGADSFDQTRIPRISPDGRTVAFAGIAPSDFSMSPRRRGWVAELLGPLAPRRAEAHGAPLDIWLADTTTAEVRRLTFIGADDPYLGWSPDGEQVIFIETNGLYEAAIDGGPLVRTGEGYFGGRLAVAPE